MKYLLITFIILLTILIFSSCYTSNKCCLTNTNTPIIEFHKFPCFGKCKVYKLIIYEDKSMILTGIRNVEYIGNYRSIMKTAQYEQLLSSFEQISFSLLENEYLTGAKDLQITEVKFKNNIVKFHKRRAPANLLQLSKEISNIIDSSKWKKII